MPERRIFLSCTMSKILPVIYRFGEALVCNFPPADTWRNSSFRKGRMRGVDTYATEAGFYLCGIILVAAGA